MEMTAANNRDGSSESLPVILALDTSSKRTSIAISKGHRIIANFEVELDDNRSARLWELIDFLLNAAGLKIEDVNLFAVCIGPGGFTGLRVGISAIQGFAVATQRLAIGVSSLEALAAAAFPATRVCVLSNAYKGEVYSQLFSFDESGLPVADTPAKVSALSEVLEGMRGMKDLTFVGDGADAAAEAILQFKTTDLDSRESKRSSHSGWSIKKNSGFLAEPIARLAYDKLLTGQAVVPEKLKACYVRSADVKIKQV
jgi:tRNA threonylcarbamoyl adenosine modification protein YeaZ